LVDPNQIKSAKVRQVYEYWLSKKTSELLPGRADIEPREMKSLSDCTFLVDVLHVPLHFKVRFFGTRLVFWAGCDLTGMVIRQPEVSAPLRPWRQIFQEYCSVVEAREPRYDEHSMEWGKEHQRFERIIAPLSSDGKMVNMLFGALDLHATPAIAAASLTQEAPLNDEESTRLRSGDKTAIWRLGKRRS